MEKDWEQLNKTPKFKWSYSSPGDYQIEISIFDKSGSTTHSTKISAIGEKKAKAFFEMKDTIFYTGDILPLDAIKSSPRFIFELSLNS